MLTEDDKNNPVTGNLAATSGAYFQQVYQWNVSYNNFIVGCGNGATDGNGIIADTWAGDNACNGTTHSSTEPPVYAHQGLIAFNVTFHNGAKGIQIFANDLGEGVRTPGVGITVANNASYNNNLDLNDTGADRAKINENCGGNNTFINNIAYAIRSPTGVKADNNTYVGDLSGGAPSTFANNVGYWLGAGAGEGMYKGAVWITGQEPANPRWVNVGNTSLGTASMPPVAANFALQSGSLAIGYGLTETYLSSQSVDAGACYHTLTSCP